MYTLLLNLLDRRDEQHARRRRQQLGQSCWLLSWAPTPEGRWLARLSCPELPQTIEQFGRSRRAAIRAAEQRLRHWLEGRV